MDLRLQGSQINLVTRPKQTRDRSRPNSSISAFCRRPDSSQAAVRSYTSAFRPFSADSPTHNRPKSASIHQRSKRLLAQQGEYNGNRSSSVSARLLQSMIAEPLGRSWDETSTGSKGSSDDSLGARIRTLARDSAENINELEREYRTPDTSELFGSRRQLNRDEIENYGEQMLGIGSKMRDHVQFNDNVEVFFKSDNNSFTSEEDNDAIMESSPPGARISPGLTRKPPLPSSARPGGLRASLNDSNEQPTRDAWPADRNKPKDITGRVSFYKENSNIALDQYDVIEDDGEGLSVDEEIENILTQHEESVDRSEINTDLIIEDYKKEIETINAKHAEEIENNEDECTAIDEHFEYLNEYEEQCNTLFAEETDLGYQENSSYKDTNTPKRSTPEIVSVKMQPTNLSNYLENESDISQDGVISEYRTAVGEIKRPERSFSVPAVKVAKEMESRTNDLMTSMNEITDSSNAVISKYFKVKNSPIKGLPKKPEGFHNRRAKSVPSLAFKTNKQREDDAHIPEVRNQDLESWMSRSFSPSGLQGMSQDLLQDVEIPDLDGMSEQEEEKHNVTSTENDRISNDQYGEIAAILREIEGDEMDIDDKSRTFSHYEDHEIEKLLNMGNNLDKESIKKTSKYKDILCFLDEVDVDCENVLKAAKSRIKNVSTYIDHGSGKHYTGIPANYDDIPKLHDLLSLSNAELANMVISLSVQLQEQICSTALLNEALADRRDQQEKERKSLRKQQQDKLRAQKQDFEEVVRRHQKFIDQLISDKKTLNAHCDQLMTDVRSAEQRHTHNMQAAEQRHALDLQRTKDKMAAAERLRRDRWMEAQAKKIKEMTVKGMAGELDSISAKHSAQLEEMRLQHEREMREAAIKHQQEAQRRVEATRDEMMKDQEQALLRERERFELQFNSERQSLDVLRLRLQEEMSAERRRVEEAVTSLRRREEEIQRAAEADRKRAIADVKLQHEQEIEAVKKRYETELAALRQDAQMEQEAARAALSKQSVEALRQSEKEIREACKIERDRQIEKVIEKVERECQEIRRHVERQAENRLRRQKEKYEIEMCELSKSEKQMQDKVHELKQKYFEAEEANVILHANIKQLELERKHSQKICDTLTTEREQIRDEIRAEFNSQLLTLQNKMAAMREHRDTEIQQIYTRVKLAVAKKDSSLQLLQAEYDRISEKCSNLEKTLNQQRYLLHKK